MSDSLKKKELLAHLLIFGEQPERFAHIALYKRGNERITRFYKKTYTTNFLQTYIKIQFYSIFFSE